MIEKNKREKFYLKCKEEDCLDVSDQSKRVRAKVIASDLGLNYKDINELLNLSSNEYETKLVKEEREKRLLEKVNSEQDYLFIVNCQDLKIKVYREEKNTVFCAITEGQKTKVYDGISFAIKNNDITMHSYQPSKAVYTSATVGGITTGGIHYTKDYYSTQTQKTGKGFVYVTVDGKEYLVVTICFSDEIAKKFKTDPSFWKNRSCKKDDPLACYNASILAGKDAMTQLNYMSVMVDKQALEVEKLSTCLDYVYSVINEKYPDDEETLYKEAIQMTKQNTAKSYSDAIAILETRLSKYPIAIENLPKIKEQWMILVEEEDYCRAIKLSQSNNFNDLSKAKSILESLGDYKDSKKILSGINQSYNSKKRIHEKNEKKRAISNKILFVLLIIDLMVQFFAINVLWETHFTDHFIGGLEIGAFIFGIFIVTPLIINFVKDCC